jgi:hypothetical protein
MRVLTIVHSRIDLFVFTCSSTARKVKIMVTKAIPEGNWQRASYLELDAKRQPQAIGSLMSQVLSRYALATPPAVIAGSVTMEDRHYDDEEDMHTLAALTTADSR